MAFLKIYIDFDMYFFSKFSSYKKLFCSAILFQLQNFGKKLRNWVPAWDFTIYFNVSVLLPSENICIYTVHKKEGKFEY